jgi:hypothetical protein
MSMNRQLLRRSLALLTTVTLSALASAHHSVARFDRENQIAVEGTLKEFRWGNPHTWMVLIVPNDKGGTDEWEMEGGAVNGMVRQGWTRNTLQPGQKLRVVVSPMKDGSLGGEWMRVLLRDGQPLVLNKSK